MAAAVAVILSSSAYFLFSEGFRGALVSRQYRRFLYHEFATTPHQALIEPIHFRPAGLLAVSALAISALTSALLLRRAVRSTARDVMPEIIAYGTASVVVPPLLIAAAWWPDGRGQLSTPALLAASILVNVALLPWAWRGGRVSQREQARKDARSRWVAAFAVPTLLFAAVVATFGASAIRGFDSYAYHLPLAASWLRHGSLRTNVEESVTFFFPSNTELLVRWILATGADRLAFLVAFASAALCIFVLYKICLEMDQPRSMAALAALSAASCISLSFLASAVYVDSFVTLALLLALLFLLRSRKAGENDFANDVALGTAIGLAIGSKYSAIPAAVVIFALWFWTVLRRNARPYEGCFRLIQYRAVARHLVACGIPMTLCCAYWYIRNAVEYGNPLFPVAMFGWRGMPMKALIEVNPGLEEPFRWLLYPWREFGYRSLEDALGAVFAGAAAIGFLIAPFRRERPKAVHLVWWVVLASCALWLLTGNVVLRYGLFPILLTYAFLGELLIAYDSKMLRTAIFVAFAGTLILFGDSYVTQVIYTSVIGPQRYGVPVAVDHLPPGRIFNALSADANYFLMGADYRHEVVSVYAEAKTEDVLRFAPDYLLLNDGQVRSFAAVASLELVARAQRADGRATSLWRVRSRVRPVSNRGEGALPRSAWTMRSDALPSPKGLGTPAMRR